MYDYILFDLDGTLTDPGLGITNSVMYALKKWNIEVKERSELYRFIGPPLLDSFAKYYGFTPSMCQEAVKEYRVYFSGHGIFENEVYPGIPEMLEKLKKAGKKLIIATSKPDEFSIRILKHFDLYKYFDFIGASCMDETRSNKWEVIQYALDSMKITDYKKVLMVGDREHDIIGGKKVGVDTLGVLYGYGSLEELKKAGANYIAATVEEIPKFC